jgi:hypothetical protein
MGGVVQGVRWFRSAKRSGKMSLLDQLGEGAVAPEVEPGPKLTTHQYIATINTLQINAGSLMEAVNALPDSSGSGQVRQQLQTIINYAQAVKLNAERLFKAN